MIVLDTNFLIVGLVPGTAQNARLRQWVESAEPLAVSVFVWAEFLCGPVTPDHVRLATQLFPSPTAVSRLIVAPLAMCVQFHVSR